MNRGLRFTAVNFSQEVLYSEMPVLVDFWGSWCPPCKMVEGLVDDLAEEFAGKLKVGKLNVDQNPRIRDEFNIGGVPTFMLFKHGKVVKREIGARSKQQLRNMIQEALKK